jgi:hypothetical protein
MLRANKLKLVNTLINPKIKEPLKSSTIPNTKSVNCNVINKIVNFFIYIFYEFSNYSLSIFLFQTFKPIAVAE